MNGDVFCINCTSLYNCQLIECPFCNFNPYLQPNPAKATSKIQCPSCQFENDVTNEMCVACEVFLYADKVEEKNCQHCKLVIPSVLYEQHSTNCLLSLQLIQREQYQQRSQQLKKNKDLQCQHCGLDICFQEYQEHSTHCLLSRELIEQEELERTSIEEQKRRRELQKLCLYCSIRYPSQLLDSHIKVCPEYLKKNAIKPSSKPQVNVGAEKPGIVINKEPLIPASEYKEGQFLQKSEILRLTQLQYNAISHMHGRANKQSNNARAEVQKRARRLGCNAKDLQNLLFYIENYAPVIVHIHIMRYMEFFIKDTHYRNQFETGKSSGSLSRGSRTQWEDNIFDKTYSGCRDFERVKYGVINMTNDPKGVNCATGYGLSYMLLKDTVRGRCTITDKDSSSADARVGTFKYCLHILQKLSQRELMSAFKAAKAMEESSSVMSTYKQIQIHGPLEFAKDVQRLYVNKKEVQDKKFLEMVYTFSQKFGVDYQFF